MHKVVVVHKVVVEYTRLLLNAQGCCRMHKVVVECTRLLLNTHVKVVVEYTRMLLNTYFDDKFHDCRWWVHHTSQSRLI